MNKLVRSLAVLALLSAAVCPARAGEFKIPQALKASDLAALQASLPGMVDIVDIRSPEEFAEYSVPGAVNVDPDKLLASAVYYTGPGALVLVDKDGGAGLALAGVLAQKNKRDIKVIEGGAKGYWFATEFVPVVRDIPAAKTALSGESDALVQPNALPDTRDGAPEQPAIPSQKDSGV